MVYYRPALFERAGVDPAAAFGSTEQFEIAVRRLQASGVETPLTIPTGYTHTTLLNVASWTWANGGDFLSPDGRRTCFMEREALEGMRAYFALGRYLSSAVRRLNGLEPDERLLTNPDTALTVTGPWLFCSAQQRNIGLDSIAAALPPGPPFIGGSNLLIWKYSRNPEAAVQLVRFLTQEAALVDYCPFIGLLPARLGALSAAPFSEDSFWRTAVHGLETGRSFPTIRLWGLVEDRLTTGFSAVWADLLEHSQVDPLAVLKKHLGPLAERLDLLLSQG
jgi:multiple sugar transport system substrate-binding protein